MPTPEFKPGSLRSLAAISLLAAAACSDSNSSSLPVTTLSVSLNSAQETTATTLGTNVRVTVRNLAPDMGTFHTPVWIGIHDGTFDTYDLGVPASAALENFAEDGNFAPLMADFAASGADHVDGLVLGAAAPVPGPIAPGEGASAIFRVDPTGGAAIFLSYASMILPSNDAFIANGDPTAHQIYDAAGVFAPTSFTVAAAAARDAGTEVNDEIPANTPLLGQMAANTGTTEGGNVTAHPGFLAVGMGGILDLAMFANADFATVPGYEFISIDVTEEVPGMMPSGTSTLTLNGAGTMLTYDITALDLSGPATGLHLHQGAMGVGGAVLLDLMGGISTNSGGTMRASGSIAVTTMVADMIKTGDTYLNVHTALNPAGEIRGQATVGEVFGATIDGAQETSAPILGSDITVIVQNRAPAMGTFQTPLWVAFHDGTFDIYDSGSAASAPLERLAEDGDVSALNMDFTTSMAGTVVRLIPGIQTPGPIAPGETTAATYRLDPMNLNNGFLSWASMILPSNDAFAANGDPLAHPVFDGMGAFVGADFTVAAAMALDAGTEVNDEVPANTAFFGMMAPDTGTVEGSVIGAHPGYLAMGMGGILDDAMFANADFANTAGYEFMRIFMRENAAPTAASGTANIALAADGITATIHVTGLHLSGIATGLHIHMGATGASGGVEVDLAGLITHNAGGTLVASGMVVLTPAQATALRAGNLYVNVHTALNPGGEIRGQF